MIVWEEKNEPLRAFVRDNGIRRTYRRHSRPNQAGERLSHVLLVVDGWVARVRTDEDGTSAFMALHMTGDVVGADVLGGFVDDELLALTDLCVVEAPVAALRARAAADASLALSLASLLAAETHFLREALFAVGRQPSDSRLCTFFLQTFYRQVAAGLASADSFQFDLPLTQSELANATGLTSVHTSRTLKVLRDRGWLEFHGGTVRLLDVEALQQNAQVALRTQ